MRKFLIPILLTALCCAPSWAAQITLAGPIKVAGPVTIPSGAAAPPVVQPTCSTNGDGTSAPCTFFPHGAGDILVVWGSETATNALATPTGTGGCPASFTPVTSTVTGDAQQWAIGTASGTSSCTVTVSFTGSATFINVIVWDIQNATTTVDGSPSGATSFSANGAVSTTYNAPPVTTTVNGDIILTGSFSSNSSVQTVSAPFTQDSNDTTFGGYVTSGHDIQVSSGTITPGWTTGGATSVITATLAVEP